MSNPYKWGWGLLPLAAVWVGSNFIQNGGVSADLHARATAATGLQAENVTVKGRDVTLSGLVFTPGAGKAAHDATLREWGVRTVSDKTELPATAAPYATTIASTDGQTVVLSGNVPDPATRAAIVAGTQTAWPSARIEDKMTYALGAPEGFTGIIAAGVALAAKLENGGLALKDKVLAITGTAPDRALYRTIAATAAPGGVTLDTSAVVAPAPYTFTAERTGNVVALEGLVPSEDVHGSLVQSARDMFFDAQIEDRLKVDADAPAGIADVLAAGLGALSRLGSGIFSVKGGVDGGDVTLTGAALYDRASTAIRDTLTAALPAGYRLGDVTLTTAAPVNAMSAEACQIALNTILSQGSIRFGSDSAVLSPVSAGILDRLVTTVAACPGNPIRIEGHTDASGSAQINQPLSENRAKSVVEYLVAAGLPEAQFATAGFGASRPIATNDTEEGRARNRRIEFVIGQAAPAVPAEQGSVNQGTGDQGAGEQQ